MTSFLDHAVLEAANLSAQDAVQILFVTSAPKQGQSIALPFDAEPDFAYAHGELELPLRFMGFNAAPD